MAKIKDVKLPEAVTVLEVLEKASPVYFCICTAIKDLYLLQGVIMSS